MKGSLLVAMSVVVGVTALALTSGALARSNYSAYYIDELSVSNAMEKSGIYYNGSHRNVDTASCIGLRRYGVRPDTYGLDKFHRFKCDADGADSHIYTVQVSTTSGPKRGWWYSHYLSVTRDF